MKNLKIKFIFFLLIFVDHSFSQNDNITVYDPFKPSQVITPDEANKMPSAYKNCIKWNSFLLYRGVFQINYERALNKIFTIEGGIGLTYRDYVLEFSSILFETDAYFDLPFNDVVVTPGLAFELTPRLYPKDGYFDGFYISPLFRYRYYNIEAGVPSNNYQDYYYIPYKPSNDTYDAGYNVTEYGFLMGLQTEGWLWDVMWDYYFGVGYRNCKYQNYELDFNGIYQLEDKIIARPFILCGVKMGFTF